MLSAHKTAKNTLQPMTPSHQICDLKKDELFAICWHLSCHFANVNNLNSMDILINFILNISTEQLNNILNHYRKHCQKSEDGALRLHQSRSPYAKLMHAINSDVITINECNMRLSFFLYQQIQKRTLQIVPVREERYHAIEKWYKKNMDFRIPYRRLIKNLKVFSHHMKETLLQKIYLMEKILAVKEKTNELYIYALLEEIKHIIILLKYDFISPLSGYKYDISQFDNEEDRDFYVTVHLDEDDGIIKIIPENKLEYKINEPLTQNHLNQIFKHVFPSILTMFSEVTVINLVKNWGTKTHDPLLANIINSLKQIIYHPVIYYNSLSYPQNITSSLFVPNTNTFNTYWTNNSNQELWGKLWAESCNITAMHIKNKTSVTQDIKTLYLYLAKHRANAAYIMDADETYGVYRVGAELDSHSVYREFFYKNHSRYHDQYTPLKNRITQLLAEHKENDNSYHVHRETGVYFSQSSKELRKYSMESCTINGDFINAQGISRKDAYIHIGLIRIKATSENDEDQEYIVGSRIPTDTLEDFFRGTEAVYQELLNYQGSDNQQFYRLLGRLLWHLACPMPLAAGSTAVNEAIVRAFEIARGLTPTPFKPGVTPDFCAYFSPNREEFANNFFKLFTGNSTILDDAFSDSPTTLSDLNDKKWLAIKEKDEFPLYNQNLSDSLDGDYPEPLFKNNNVPWYKNSPCVFREPMVRLRINRHGMPSLIRNLEAIKEYYFNLPFNHPTQIVSYLKNDGLEALIYSFKEYPDLTDRIELAHAINHYISTNTFDSLKYLRYAYIVRKYNLLWIESLPQDDSTELQEKLYSVYKDLPDYSVTQFINLVYINYTSHKFNFTNVERLKEKLKAKDTSYEEIILSYENIFSSFNESHTERPQESIVCTNSLFGNRPQVTPAHISEPDLHFVEDKNELPLDKKHRFLRRG